MQGASSETDTQYEVYTKKLPPELSPLPSLNDALDQQSWNDFDKLVEIRHLENPAATMLEQAVGHASTIKWVKGQERGDYQLRLVWDNPQDNRIIQYGNQSG